MTWVPMDPEDSAPRRVGESLDRVTRSLGLPGADALEQIFVHWPDAVGEQIAAHSRPLSLRNKRLVVGVDHPGWATQLRYLEQELVGRLAEATGEVVVAAIDVRVMPS